MEKSNWETIRIMLSGCCCCQALDRLALHRVRASWGSRPGGRVATNTELCVWDTGADGCLARTSRAAALSFGPCCCLATSSCDVAWNVGKVALYFMAGWASCGNEKVCHHLERSTVDCACSIADLIFTPTVNTLCCPCLFSAVCLTDSAANAGASIREARDSNERPFWETLCDPTDEQLSLNGDL